MEGVLDSLTKYFHTVNEALETAKKYLLRRNQILDEKYDMEREWSNLVEKQAQRRRLDDEIYQDQCRYLEETFRELEDQLNEFDKRERIRRTYVGVDYFLQCGVKE